jgi:hypothetical protein
MIAQQHSRLISNGIGGAASVSAHVGMSKTMRTGQRKINSHLIDIEARKFRLPLACDCS